MKMWLICLLLWIPALFLGSCGDDSVLILEDRSRVQLLEPSGAEDCAALEGQELSEESAAIPKIMVHVCGCVADPGVYAIPEGSRVYEAIRLAGGFLPEAAENYLNLAQVVTDGQKLVVPSADEVMTDRYGQIDDDGENRPVNINTADKERLMTLPGIGESRAEAIISWREKNGRFRTAEDIMQVSGIKEAAYENIKERITVE